MNTIKANGGASDKKRPFELRVICTEPGLPRLILWKKDVCQMLGVSQRTLDRMVSTGEIPRPNRRLRGRPAWFSLTIYEWVAEGCLGTPMHPRLTGASGSTRPPLQ